MSIETNADSQVPFWIWIFYILSIVFYLTLVRKKSEIGYHYSFLAILFTLGIQSLVQDFAGQKAWINHVKDHWFDSTCGILIASLVVAFVLMRIRGEKNSTGDSNKK